MTVSVTTNENPLQIISTPLYISTNSVLHWFNYYSLAIFYQLIITLTKQNEFITKDSSFIYKYEQISTQFCCLLQVLMPDTSKLTAKRISEMMSSRYSTVGHGNVISTNIRVTNHYHFDAITRSPNKRINVVRIDDG